MLRKRIIIIDDEPLMAVLMKELLEEEAGLEISFTTNDKNEFLNAVTQEDFDIALMDMSVGEQEGGLELLKFLKNKGVFLPAIVISAHDEILYAHKCLTYGARGYICKTCISAELITALKEVLQGNLYISGRNGAEILREYKKNTAI